MALARVKSGKTRLEGEEKMSRKSLIASLLVAAFAVFALADDGDNNQNANFSSTVIGSTPGTIVAGINSGGVS